MVDLDEARTGEEAPPEEPGSPPTKEGRRPFRRVLIIVIAILAVVLLYAFAFDRTNVELDEIQSETRQEQLFRILRALVRPDLITYDTEDLALPVNVFVPCNGASTAPVSSETEGRTLTVTPGCASPGESMTASGTGYNAGDEVRVQFIPVSDFDVILPIERVTVAEDGTWSSTFEAPERESAEPQQVVAVTNVNVGSWFNRQPVWTDTNLNGIEDPTVLPDSDAALSVSPLVLPEFTIRSPGGAALVDENRNVLQFVSWGGSFEATNGPAVALESTDVGGDAFVDASVESMQLAGTGAVVDDFAWTGPAGQSFDSLNAGQTADGDADGEVFINELAFEGTSTVELAGPPGTSLEGLSITFYDADGGGQYKSVGLTDRSDLSPRLSDNAIATWNRIVETVMLALLATTVGTCLAVPISFFAAKNLMREISVPVINLALVLLAILIGLVLGPVVAGWARSVSDVIAVNAWTAALGIVVIGAAIRYGIRWTVPEVEEANPPMGLRVARASVMIASAFGFLVIAFLVGEVMQAFGQWMARWLPIMVFLGTFVSTLGEIIGILVAIVAAFLAAGGLAIAASHLGYYLRANFDRRTVNAITFVASAIAGFAAGAAVGAIISWFGNFDDNTLAIAIPAGIGALLGVILAARALRRETQNVGLTVYFGARTLFNGLRSIEPLVMVIIFVVWVGIGPFAGALALALHTTAALAKLYSEQVESIESGPLEAVRATGATRMQTVIYAVVPQIVAPYISFTMYRWDINVRMSTIIGFAGGGGIGFLLQQNINLLQYRAAAAQMLAIAIVVATMDYISSRLRERFV
ncbi:MAG: ABC transporter permease subunit [Acidimicrobiia bacterium]|nr:ABC transporter permease subunit [Acidimicrobiia bacterium]